MLVDAFKPSYQGTVTCSVTAASQTFKLDDQGECLLVQNTSAAVTIFCETGTSSVVAAVASGFPVLPGATRVIRRKSAADSNQMSANPGLPDNYIAIIGSAAGPTNVYVSSGAGGI